MTKREFLVAIANGTMNEEMQAYAEETIAKMDAAVANRKTKPTKAQIENAPLCEKVKEMDNEIFTSAVVAEALEVHPSKATAILKALVKEGYLVQEGEAKGKSNRPVKAYKRA